MTRLFTFRVCVLPSVGLLTFPFFLACAAGDGGGVGTGGTSSTGAATGTGGDGLGTGSSSATGGNSTTGGAPGTGGTATGGASGDPCATAMICDDFEGSMDPLWSIQKDSVPAPALDATKGANGSSSSLKVTGSPQQSFLVAEVPAQSFYVRAYMNFETATSAIGGHGWFIVGADNATSGEGNQMRLGASANHGHPEVDFNVYGNTCSGEKTHFSDGANDATQGWNNTTDTVLNFAADQWYCVEAFFDGTGQEFRFWVDEVEHAGLHVTETNMCANWAPTYTHVKVGAGNNGGNIWYDDVVISTTPIGCL